MAQQATREVISRNVVRILRDERKRQQLSIEKLARHAGLSQAMISFIERAIRNPTLDTLLRICGVLEIHLDDVIRQARLSDAKR